MAKIVLNDNAPAEAIHFSLGLHEFDLGAGIDSYETEDRGLISNAYAHPWLTVEEEHAVGYESYERQAHIAPEDDALSAVHGALAFDPEEIRKVEEAKYQAEASPLAIDAGLDQDEPKQVGAVAVTLAADESHEAADSADNFAAEDPADTPTTEENE